jgi:hypothetical protein
VSFTLGKVALGLVAAGVLAFVPLAVADSLYVASGQNRASFWAPSNVGEKIVFTLSYVTFGVVLWLATRGRRLGPRIALVVLGGALAFAAWLHPATLALYWFHLAIGGVE